MLMLSNLKRTLGTKFALKTCLRLPFVIMVMIDINIKPVGDNANRFFVLEAR